jgi:hypothetical protein
MECWWCFEPIVEASPSTTPDLEGGLHYFHPGCLAEHDGWLTTLTTK